MPRPATKPPPAAPRKNARGRAGPAAGPVGRGDLILRGSSDGFVTLDAEQRITFANEAAAKILGQAAAALVGKKNWPELAGTVAAKLEKACRRAGTEQTAVEFEDALAPGDRWFSVRAYPIAAGEVAVCFRNITDRKRGEAKATALRRALETQVDDLRRVLAETSRARDAAEEAGRAKDDFLNAISHELRTPLSPVLLLASEAAGNSELRDEVREDFRTIARNVALEARLIDDLLDQMRLSRGKLSLALATVDVHAILRETAAAMKGELEQKRIALRVECQAGQHVINGDAVRLQQVFWNVLQNALKFVSVGGRIAIETRDETEKNQVVITLSASGPEGAPPGPQAENAGSRRTGGLGLTLARTLVELHSGRLRSSGSGHAAAFLIELPLLSPEKATAAGPAPAAPAKPADAATLRSRILLVEDHEPTRIALAQMLVRRRYRVATAGSVAEAMALAERKEFDLVVSDIGLPDADGYQLMAGLRELHGLRGIAITGYGMEQDIARGQTAGFIAHLIKPISAQMLENALVAATGP